MYATSASTASQVGVRAAVGPRGATSAAPAPRVLHTCGCGCGQCSAARLQTSRRKIPVVRAAVDKAVNAAIAELVDAGKADVEYMLSRNATIQKHFPGSVAVDDFLFRLEMALCSYGFTGENTIAIVNLCRDEVTNIVRVKLEEIFPLVFNINGLGAGITCGVTGLKAGLSHSPECSAGKQRYVFFSFPHIAINSKGEVGTLPRPGQAGQSCACGAMIAALGQIKSDGLEVNILRPGVHTPADPEYSILKQRIARRILKEEKNVDNLDLVEFTKIAERQISDDLNQLVAQAVVPEDADFAVITGVQIHNWGETYDGDEPKVEWLYPTNVSVTVNGKKTSLDLSSMPALTPRQIRMLSGTDSPESVAVYTGSSTISSASLSGIFSSEKLKK